MTSIRKYFDPDAFRKTKTAPARRSEFGDRSSPSRYKHTEETILAVNLALCTGRNLLVRGKAGAGKSSLAANVAWHLERRFYSHVVTSRTQAQDLLWSFDAVRRLNDATVGSTVDPDATAGGGSRARARVDCLHRYIDPGALWWAFERDSAERRGAPTNVEVDLPAQDWEENQARNSPGAVVLIDEIDKADPDVPNDLLVPLGALEFTVRELGRTIRVHPKRRPLVVITTNNERELPDAFVRRCVVLDLPDPDVDWLAQVAKVHLGKKVQQLHRPLAERVLELSEEAKKQRRRAPSTAEYLDALRVCADLGIDLGHRSWAAIETAVLRKSPQQRAASSHAGQQELINALLGIT